MKIYDISQEVLNCVVYPGDESPVKKVVYSMEEGSLYNLTSFSMCSHNGTHIDAPYHFYKEGKTIDEIPLDKTIGYCFVVNYDKEMSKEDAYSILNRCRSLSKEASKRLLIKGNGVITLEAAKVLSELQLIGSESQSVGPLDAPMAVHLELLKHEVVLLEGIVLKNVEEGIYFLNATPLNLKGFDGSPCRAILIKEDDV